ncbi:hypothetical protein GCM10027416_26090 [Okibacterium endophyticum]
MTQNILAPHEGGWEDRQPRLARALSALDADVYALQEVPVASDDAVRTAVGLDGHVLRHSSASEEGVGAAVISRWPLTLAVELDGHVTERTSAESWYSTVLAYVDAEPWGRLLVVHHKPSWQYGYARERELQAVEAARRAEMLADGADHVILAGDFDAEPMASSVRFWTGRQSLDGVSVAYQDAWEAGNTGGGLTFSPENRLVAQGDMPLDLGRRIDYVMCRCDAHGPTLRAADARRVGIDEPGAEHAHAVEPSDHYGVVVDYELP